MRNYERRWNIKEALLNLAFPRRCPVCDDIVPIGEGEVCTSCRIKPQYITDPVCRKCGKQLLDASQPFCKDCMQRGHIFESGRALYDYQSMRESIYRFKYKGRCEYATFYAQEIYERLGEDIVSMEADSIVPIPIHSSRLRSRGYNQALLVAQQLARLTGIPLYANLVKRVRATVPQKELDIQQRQNNLKKAFHIDSNVVKLNKTILVDDIFTTGSTLDAVALELKRHGVETVYFIALCIGESM